MVPATTRRLAAFAIDWLFISLWLGVPMAVALAANRTAMGASLLGLLERHALFPPAVRIRGVGAPGRCRFGTGRELAGGCDGRQTCIADCRSEFGRRPTRHPPVSCATYAEAPPLAAYAYGVALHPRVADRPGSAHNASGCPV